jgi:hypothetical protein
VLPQTPVDYTAKCDVVDAATVKKTLLPSSMPANLQSSGLSEPPQDPPEVPQGVCNAYLPNSSTFNRYIWVLRSAASRAHPIWRHACMIPAAPL